MISLSLIYKKITAIVAFLIILVIGAKTWSSACTKLAIRIKYGNKSTWERMFILSDMSEHEAALTVVISAIYNVMTGPTIIIPFNFTECKMNRCKPDLIVTKNATFIEEVSAKYPIATIPITVISYATAIGGFTNTDKNVISMPIWKEQILFSFPAGSKKSLFVKAAVKNISSEELYRKHLENEEKVRAVQDMMHNNNIKIEQMRKEASKRFEPAMQNPNKRIPTYQETYNEIALM